MCLMVFSNSAWFISSETSASSDNNDQEKTEEQRIRKNTLFHRCLISLYNALIMKNAHATHNSAYAIL